MSCAISMNHQVNTHIRTDSLRANKRNLGLYFLLDSCQNENVMEITRINNIM